MKELLDESDRLWKVVESWNYWRRDFEKTILREVTPEVLKYIDRPEAIYLYGPRRAGKTTVCLQLMEVLSKKHGKHSCLYVNFEEPAFASKLYLDFLTDLVQMHVAAFGKPPQFVFFDEVQNVAQWERFVRVAVDNKKFKVIVTGSSAKLLSSEFATSLGGRGFGFLVLPFSFLEFKKASNGNFSSYLETGGYPAVVLEKNKERQLRLLQEYFESTITRDIAARYAVRDVPTLRTLAIYVLTNSCKKFSYNKLCQLTGLSFDTIKLYLSYIEDAFLAFQVPFFSYSMKKGLEHPRKYYAFDTGLAAAVSKSFSPDIGRKVENSVAIELIRRGKEVQYYSNKFEVDFVVKNGLATSAINVCFAASPPAREQAALEEFSKQFKPKEAFLLKGEREIMKWLEERLYPRT